MAGVLEEGRAQVIWLLLPVAFLAGALTVCVLLAIGENDQRRGGMIDLTRRRDAA